MPGPPYLNGVKAFEAAARTGGFTAAARELHVTPAAISRMVRLLEQRLGVPLVDRRANGLGLTVAGHRLPCRADPDLCRFDTSDRANRWPRGQSGADGGGGTHFRDTVADPQARRLSAGGAGCRCADHNRWCRRAFRGRVDLRHSPRSRSLAWSGGRASVLRRSGAGVHTRVGRESGCVAGPRGGDVAARGPRAG